MVCTCMCDASPDVSCHTRTIVKLRCTLLAAIWFDPWGPYGCFCWVDTDLLKDIRTTSTRACLFGTIVVWLALPFPLYPITSCQPPWHAGVCLYRELGLGQLLSPTSSYAFTATARQDTVQDCGPATSKQLHFACYSPGCRTRQPTLEGIVASEVM